MSTLAYCRNCRLLGQYGKMRRLAYVEDCIKLPKRTVMDKTQWEQSHSYGYSKFAHGVDQGMPKKKKIWMTFLVFCLGGVFINWERVLAPLKMKVKELLKSVGFEFENPSILTQDPPDWMRVPTEWLEQAREEYVIESEAKGIKTKEIEAYKAKMAKKKQEMSMSTTTQLNDPAESPTQST